MLIKVELVYNLMAIDWKIAVAFILGIIPRITFISHRLTLRYSSYDG